MNRIIYHVLFIFVGMSTLEIIKNRRSIDPDDFNGETIAPEIIAQMLEAANWAPTHGFTEPWRFVVFEGEKAKSFGELHADLYKKLTPVEQFLQKKYEKIKFRSINCSHVIVCVNKRGEKRNIPELEENAATSCAIQNMLLVATEHKVATFWSTGGMCYHPEMKALLGFTEQDQVLGFIYAGKCSIENPQGKRNTEWKDKVEWK